MAQQPTILSPAEFYSPFVYTGTGASSENGAQGIKQAPGRNRYVITGTSGNITSEGQGSVYVGRINGSSTSQGSGSGTWVLMDVPASWLQRHPRLEVVVDEAAAAQLEIS